MCFELVQAFGQRIKSSCKAQTLLLVVQDWDREKEYLCGYEGGQQFVNNAFESGVFEDATKNFQNMACFLMPRHEEVRANFLQLMNDFVSNFLHPSLIVAKQFEGKPITPKQWLQVISSDGKPHISRALQEHKRDLKGGIPQRKKVSETKATPDARQLTRQQTVEELPTKIGKPVSITKTVNGILEIDDDVLSKILRRPEYEDKPIALISIAGCLRTGKSFMLNFLLRYLRKKGWKTPDWMGSPDTKANGGIEWRGGKDPHTLGIMMWDKAFVLERSNGEEVYLFIMDTQGLFDNNTTKQNNVKLFMLSALASSVQILNITKLIQERDLENLQLCVELALVSSQQSAGYAFKLQTLLFLIRDWPNSHENKYGFEGGQQYLDGVLKFRKDKEELDDVRKHLRESFTDLKCFLMPHPGLGVEKAASFKGANKEILAEFLEETGHFVHTLLHPDSVLEKKALGERITAKQLLHIITSADKAFEDGKLPNVETLLDAQARAHYSGAYEAGVHLYDKLMKEGKENFKGGIMDLEELSNSSKNAKRKSLDTFDTTLRFGLDKTRKQYRHNLKETCWEHFDTVKTEMENEIAKIKLQLQSLADQLVEKYANEMKKEVSGNALPKDELEALHQKHLQIVINDLKSTDEYQSMFHVSIDNMIGTIKKLYDAIVDNNAERADRMLVAKREKESLEKIEKYEEKFGRALKKFIEEYREENVMNEYCESLKVSSEDEFRQDAPFASDKHISKLQHKFSKLADDALEQNRKNLKTMKIVLQTAVDKHIETYRKDMKMEMGRQAMPEKDLKKFHDKQFAKALSAFNSCESARYHIFHKYEESLMTSIKRQYEELQELNQERLDSVRAANEERQMLEQIDELAEQYEEALTEYVEYYRDQEELELYHKEKVDDLEKKLGDGVTDDHIKKLREKFNKIHRAAVQQNRKNLAALDNRLLNLVDEYFRKYQSGIKQEVSKGINSEEILLRSHVKYSQKVLSEFASANEAKYEKIFEEYSAKLEKKIEEHFEEVKEVSLERLREKLQAKREKDLLEKIEEFVDEYEEGLVEFLETFPDDQEMSAYRKKTERELRKKFEKDIGEGEPEDLFRNMQDRFKKTYDLAFEKNKSNLEKAGMRLHARMRDLVTKGKRRIQNGLTDNYYEPKALADEIQKLEEVIKQDLGKEFSAYHCDLIESCSTRLSEDVDEVLQELNMINKKNKEMRDVHSAKVLLEEERNREREEVRKVIEILQAQQKSLEEVRKSEREMDRKAVEDLKKQLTKQSEQKEAEKKGRCGFM